LAIRVFPNAPWLVESYTLFWVQTNDELNLDINKKMKLCIVLKIHNYKVFIPEEVVAVMLLKLKQGVSD